MFPNIRPSLLGTRFVTGTANGWGGAIGVKPATPASLAEHSGRFRHTLPGGTARQST